MDEHSLPNFLTSAASEEEAEAAAEEPDCLLLPEDAPSSAVAAVATKTLAFRESMELLVLRSKEAAEVAEAVAAGAERDLLMTRMKGVI